ncbi:glycosyltransferase [Microbacterium sp. GXF7504]
MATLRVLNLYEGFFAGGARVLHTEVVAGLHGPTQQHRVLSLSNAAHREGTVQPMVRDHRYRRLVAAGVEVEAFDRTAGAEPPAPWSFTAEQLERAADAVAHADVVVVLKEQPVSLLLALGARGMLPDVPVVVCLHRSDPAHAGPALEWLRTAAGRGIVDAAVACAESTASAYGAVGALPGEWSVIPNGVDLGRFRPGRASERARIRRTLGIPDGVPVVLSAARFDPMKDPELFLRAVAAHTARSDAHYVLCGAGMERGNVALRELVARTGADAAPLHLLGIRDDMESLYRIADVVALTSAYGEASPLCLLEGAASGAVPVTTDVGDAAVRTAGFGLVTGRCPTQVAAMWDEVVAGRRRLRARTIASRPALDRRHMIEAYRAVLERAADAGRLAA